KDRFTGLVHGVNILLEPLRGDEFTKLPRDRINRYGGIERTRADDTGDKALSAVRVADSNRIVLVTHDDARPNVGVSFPRDQTISGKITERRVTIAVHESVQS